MWVLCTYKNGVKSDTFIFYEIPEEIHSRDKIQNITYFLNFPLQFMLNFFLLKIKEREFQK